MIYEKALRKWKLFLQGFFVCIKFPVRHGGNWIHLNRKLWVNSFLSGMRLWCIISIGNDWRKVSRPTWGLWCINSTGNDLRKVSCPACEQWNPTQQETIGKRFPVRHGDYGASTQQETICERFPVRHGAMVHHLNRKPFAKSFLSGMRLWCIIATGNYWRIVSHPACEQWEPSQQETISERFPVRHGAMGATSTGNYWWDVE